MNGKFAIDHGYEFHGCSRKYGQILLDHGYVHNTVHGEPSHHEEFRDYHLTLVFKKVEMMSNLMV